MASVKAQHPPAHFQMGWRTAIWGWGNVRYYSRPARSPDEPEGKSEERQGVPRVLR